MSPLSSASAGARFTELLSAPPRSLGSELDDCFVTLGCNFSVCEAPGRDSSEQPAPGSVGAQARPSPHQLLRASGRGHRAGAVSLLAQRSRRGRGQPPSPAWAPQPRQQQPHLCFVLLFQPHTREPGPSLIQAGGTGRLRPRALPSEKGRQVDTPLK